MAGIVGTEVWVLETWDRHGTDASVHASEGGARSAVVGFALSGWDSIPARPGIPKSPDDLSDEEIVKLYFAECSDEGYSLKSQKIQP